MRRLRLVLGRVLGQPWFIGAALVLWLAGGLTGTAGTAQLMSFLLVNILLAQSINLLSGLAGQTSLGQAGLFAAGAYGTALAAKSLGLPFYAAIPCGALLSAAIGLLLSFPAGRVKEVYLAMVTLGFGLVAFEVLREWDTVTGGMMGISGIPSPSLRTLQVAGLPVSGRVYFVLLTATVVATLWLTQNLIRSRVGRAFCAVHHNELAAGSIGVNRAATKRLAFVLSGLLAGLAGGCYAHLVGYLGPDSFDLQRSINILVMAIVGGLGSTAGQVMGAALFTILPERLQIFADYQYIAYGLILTLTVTLLPGGLAGLLLSPPRFARIVAPGGLSGAALAPDRTAMPQLTMEGITMRFGGLVALDDVSIALAPGRITALLGPNGSGKSTMINVIGGLYKPAKGRVTFGGRDITGLPDHAVADAGVVRTFQDPRLVPHFTVRETLLQGAHRRHRASIASVLFAGRTARAEEARFQAEVQAVLAFTHLDDVADEVIAGLPYGIRRLADVGRALLARPRVILLDEPAAGLSETEMQALCQLILDMKALGLTVLLIEHHMDLVAQLADDVVVLDSGRVIYRGDTTGMRRDAQVIAAYLGAPELVDA